MLKTAFLLACFCACPANALPARKISFMTLWSPQAQFAGYYMAQEKGIYRKYGLDVEIINSAPQKSSSDYLRSGKTDIALLWLSDAITWRDRGAKILSVGQVMQKSGLVLVAKKSSGIKTPRDMDGRKVSLWEDFQAQPLAFFRKYDVHPRIIIQAYSPNMFLRGGVDVASAMIYNEYHSLLNYGLDENELNAFFFDDYGVNFPEDGIFVLEGTHKRDPRAVCDFVKASMEGWRYAFDNRDETVDTVLRYMRKSGIPIDRKHQEWMLRTIATRIMPPGQRAGELRESDYERVAAALKSGGLVKSYPPFSRFYSDCMGYAEK